ncbi:MAG: ABC transporter ATP-binding protein [Chloroflexaceae bacterium]|nr:ABC transporter ATP-binding protein [Chloroflexaceae bacterium]
MSSTHGQDDHNDGRLSIHNLSVAYLHSPPILHSVSLDIAAGERVGLIGPNGSGKTTLFLTICGILKPSAGDVCWSGRSIKPGSFYPDIGMVFQHAADQLFCPSVRDDVAFGPLNMGLPGDEVQRRVDAALAATGAMHLLQRAPHHLSGGEKRMVAIAGVLAMHPRLMIYDEPAVGLDARARRRLIQTMQTATETLLISSHDLELIREVCQRVVILDQGNIAADGPTDTILGDAALMEAHGLERPASLRLERIE